MEKPPLIMDKIILFGASGDLAKRKILPSIAKIYTEDIKVYGYARSDLSKTYAAEIRKFHDYSSSPETRDFPEKITYIQGSYTDLTPLKEILDEHTIVYLSLPPHVYASVLSALSKYNVGIIAIEKPFGTDLESFKELMKFKNERVHFIDHYLLKSLILVIQDIYNRKPWLFDFLNKDKIENVRCLFIEKLLAEGRAYFDKYGIVRDVMQNHLTEVLFSIICDHSCGTINESRKDAVKDMSIEHDISIFGQYEGYKEEMKNDSKTETLAAFRCKVNNEKWSGIPFLMVGGKGLNEKASEIRFSVRKENFEDVLDIIKNSEDAKKYSDLYKKASRVLLVFNVLPASEIYLNIAVGDDVERIVLCGHEEVLELQHERAGERNDYEQLFECMIKGEMISTVSFDEANELWKVFEQILRSEKKLICYEPGSKIPKEAEELINTE